MKIHLIITCEHGGYHVPPSFRSLFEGHDDLLKSHRGYDLGALEVAKALAKALEVPLFFSTTTRLLVDLNRSLHHRNIFSSITSSISHEEKQVLIQNYYLPYRQAVQKTIQGLTSKNRRVLHLSVHSFTPIFNGVTRKADIGLLYDPQRKQEQTLCDRWQKTLQATTPYRVRKNFPYLGKSDGFTNYLRSQHSEESYLGIELEINQKLFQKPLKKAALKAGLIHSLEKIDIVL